MKTFYVTIRVYLGKFGGPLSATIRMEIKGQNITEVLMIIDQMFNCSIEVTNIASE